MLSKSTPRSFIVKSDKDTHFSTQLVQNAGELESLTIPNLTKTNEFIIESVSIKSDQNLEWDLILWSGVEADNANQDLDTFLDYINFPATSGKQIAATGHYYYASSAPMSIPYHDGDIDERGNDARIHCTLVNRSATTKNAGATGEVVLTIIVRPVITF